MYLEKLEIQGFKSFAHKTVLEFPAKVNESKGITAIVGPNGSGKSNTADAIRWVLGEQSIKTLRGKKSQDVIFSGSDKKARLGFAEVSLYLNNTDKQADIDYTQLEITRRVYQSGESEFFINKNRARLTDIHLLLAKANFGQRTYSIIGQGMADSVLSASLQERKDLFDEAVGVRQFQIKREQALNKFKATRDNLAQGELTLQELEPRLKSLTRQVKRLEKREEIAAELKTLQIDYFSQIWQKLETELKKVTQQKNSCEKIHNHLEKEILAIQQEIDQFSRESSRQVQFAKIQNEYNNLLAEKNNFVHDQTILQAKLNLELEQQGQGNIVWLNKRQVEISGQITNLNQQISEINNLLEQEKNNSQNKQTQIESINARLANVRTEITQKQQTIPLPFEEEKELQDIFNLQQDLVNKLLKINTLEELGEIKNQARQISQKLSVYLEKFKGAKKAETTDLVQLQKQLENLTTDKNNSTLESNQSRLNLEIKQERIQALKQEISKLKDETAKISKELSLSEINPQNKNEKNAKINAELEVIAQKLEGLEKQIAEQGQKINQFNIEEQNKKEKLLALQKDFQDKQIEINKLSQQINQFNIELAKHSTRKEDLETDIRHDQLNLEEIKAHQVTQAIDEESAYIKIDQLKRQMEIIGGIDQETQNEYEQIKERFDFLTTQSKDLEEAIKSLEVVIEELDKTIKEQFDSAFKEINREFQKYFKILFNGGQAELLKISAEDIKKEEKAEKEESGEEPPEETGILAQADKFTQRLKAKEKESYSGIEIKAVPPGKKIKSISMLSGGERALTSIALICAIIFNNPSPFIVLDEVDAPLDEANSERFSTILEELGRKTQFVVITHNRVTMHYAHVLYGVTMGDDGISKLLSVKLSDAEEMVGAARG